MDTTERYIRELAHKYNDMCYFEEDPVIFPRHFAALYAQGGATLQDVEIAAVIAAHLAWGRRAMIVRDCKRAFDQMEWKPYNYVMAGKYRNDDLSLHRTVKWSDFAGICGRLKEFYSHNISLESLSVQEIRVKIYGQKEDRNAANKKINMLRRWMVRDDNIVDLGVWKSVDKSELIIPLDIHVHRSALSLGLTARKNSDSKCATEITQRLKEIFHDDPCLGDFALFAHAVSKAGNSSSIVNNF